MDRLNRERPSFYWTKFCGPLKGNGYHPSYEFNVSLSAERLTSSWNLVEIDGEWKIIADMSC